MNNDDAAPAQAVDGGGFLGSSPAPGGPTAPRGDDQHLLDLIELGARARREREVGSKRDLSEGFAFPDLRYGTLQTLMPTLSMSVVGGKADMAGTCHYVR